MHAVPLERSVQPAREADVVACIGQKRRELIFALRDICRRIQYSLETYDVKALVILVGRGSER